MKKVYSVFVYTLILSLFLIGCSMFQTVTIKKVPGISYRIQKDMMNEESDHAGGMYFYTFESGDYISVYCDPSVVTQSAAHEMNNEESRELFYKMLFQSLKQGFDHCEEIESKDIKILGNPAKQIDYSQQLNGTESCGRMIIFYYDTMVYVFDYNDLDMDISQENLNTFMKIIRSVRKR